MRDRDKHVECLYFDVQITGLCVLISGICYEEGSK
jgi:hypothetical protein